MPLLLQADCEHNQALRFPRGVAQALRCVCGSRDRSPSGDERGLRSLLLSVAILLCPLHSCAVPPTIVSVEVDAHQEGPPKLGRPSALRGWLSFYNRRGVIYVVVIDPCGRWIVAAGRDTGTGDYEDHGDVKFYDIRTGEVVGSIVVANRVGNVALSPDGTTLAVVGRFSHTVLFYHITEDGAFMYAHSRKVDFRPDLCFRFLSRHFVAAGDGRVLIWNTSDWTMDTMRIPGVESVACSPTSSHLAVASVFENRSVLRVWDLGKANERTELAGRPPLAFLAEGRLLAYRAHDSNDIMLFDYVAREARGLLPDSGLPWLTFSVSAGGRSLAALDDTGIIRVWDLSQGRRKLVGSLSVPRSYGIAFTQDEDVLAAVAPWGKGRSSEKPIVELWRVSTGRLAHHFPTRHRRMSLQGSILAIYTDGGEHLDVWDVTDAMTPKLLWEDRWRDKPWHPFE